MNQAPSAIVRTAGRTPKATPAIATTATGWRQPKRRPATSWPNAATTAPADKARPRATGTSSRPTSGTRNGSVSRSCSTARARKTTTSPAARAAHVRRHDLATARATTTGTYRASAATSKRACADRHRRHVDDATPERARQRGRRHVVPRPGRRPRQVQQPRRRAGGEAQPGGPAGGAQSASRRQAGDGQHQRDDDGDDEHRRRQRRRRRGHEGDERRAPEPLAPTQADDPVDQVVGCLRIGGPDADRCPQEVDEPRDRRRTRRAPVRRPVEIDAGRERHGGVDGEHGHARPVGGEQRRQAPRAPHADDDAARPRGR